ncbi:MAG: hypothetical protein CMO41_07115 [Verrucomicrobiales bacterium]|nr:hypothetical protein [Verrucomicrobiales bacterium]
MEIWLQVDGSESISMTDGVDRFIGEGNRPDRLHVDGARLMEGDEVVGAYVHIEDGTTQQAGMAHIGTVDWILVQCETWSMIPLENLVAHQAGSHTKIAAMISSPLQAQGAGFALQKGVDALVIPPDREVLEAALSVKAQRLEQSSMTNEIQEINTDRLTLVPFVIESVEEAGLGDRFCLDFLSQFNEQEGLLVGSSAQALFLVHSETIPSTFVPTRPFRVNAGAPHSYVMMADGSTKYMSELGAGDELLAVNAEGDTRPVVLGRLKIEQRPMLKISGESTEKAPEKPRKTLQNANTSHVFMQQAETVRLVSDEPNAVSVTELTPKNTVLGWIGHAARHVGLPVEGEIVER